MQAQQTDQDSLPPYEVLDGILSLYVDQEQSREDIIATGYAAGVVDYVLNLVRINEWKRHQAAPGRRCLSVRLDESDVIRLATLIVAREGAGVLKGVVGL